MLTISQVAEELGCSRRQVYRLIDAGELSFIPIGERARRIEESEVERFKAANRIRKHPTEVRAWASIGTRRASIRSSSSSVASKLDALLAKTPAGSKPNN